MIKLRSLAVVLFVLAGAAVSAAAEPVPVPAESAALPPCPPQPSGSAYKPGENPPPAPAPAPAPEPKPAPKPAFKKAPFKPPPPRAAVPPAPECGGVKNPCPLQAWMRDNMARASASNDGERLAAALTKMGSYSPVPTWKWNQMSNDAAALAKAGDIEGARQACRKCHEAYKIPYKDKFRKRPAP